MLKKQISIEGMSCGHCVNHVTEALKGVEGVSNIQVNLQSKNAIIEVISNVADTSLKEAIEDVVYDVTSIQQM